MDMKWQDMYAAKKKSAEEIVAMIPNGSRCATPCGLGEAVTLRDALAERAIAEDLSGIEHHLLLTLVDSKIYHPGMEDKMKHVSWFTGGFARKAVQTNTAEYMPGFYKDTPRMWREEVKADIFYGTVSPMDKHGYFSFGLGTSTARDQMLNADLIFLEVNENFPRTQGTGMVHVSEIDGLCESSPTLVTLPNTPISEKDAIVGEFIADRIPDGATIQLGIGGIPNAVGDALKSKQGLGIHSEMFNEVMMELMECGAVTNANKAMDKYKSVAGFGLGSTKLYDFVEDNPGVEFRSIEYLNDPYNIAKHDNFVSINATLEVDLLGQVCSESIGSKPFSGTGGQLDYVRGANASKGGQSFISTYSTAKNDTITKIKPILTHGAHVTCSKNDVDMIVTEYGIAKLKGRTASQRAKAMIEIAHPDFREELEFEAKKMNMIP